MHPTLEGLSPWHPMLLAARAKSNSATLMLQLSFQLSAETSGCLGFLSLAVQANFCRTSNLRPPSARAPYPEFFYQFLSVRRRNPCQVAEQRPRLRHAKA